MENDRNRMITAYVSFVLAARIKIAKWPKSRDELEKDYFQYMKPIKDEYKITLEEFNNKQIELEQEPFIFPNHDFDRK